MWKQYENNAHIKSQRGVDSETISRKTYLWPGKVANNKKQQCGQKLISQHLTLTLKIWQLSYKSICNKWLISGACINTQLEVVFSDNNKRITNVDLITFKSFQWLMTKWWRIVGNCCFEIEITFKMTCHRHCYITLKRIYIISSHHMFYLFFSLFQINN